MLNYDKDYKIKYVNVRSFEGGIDIIARGLGIVLFILLFMNLFYGALGNTEPITFTSFFQYMSEIPYDFSGWFNIDLTIQGNWGWFDFFREFINQISSMLSLSVSVVGLIGFVFVFLLRVITFFT